MSFAAEFEIQNQNPKFLCRNGPARVPGAKFSQRKLCFVSTDRELLARHLLLLSKRDDCHFVKFSVNPRGGMYLGRCFLMTDAAVGRVWAEYKLHPSLFCVVQDDTFMQQFRDLADRCDALWLDDDRRDPAIETELASNVPHEPDP
jgi:hypothetical protein